MLWFQRLPVHLEGEHDLRVERFGKRQASRVGLFLAAHDATVLTPKDNFDDVGMYIRLFQKPRQGYASPLGRADRLT
jgi:hypothetical protein